MHLLALCLLCTAFGWMLFLRRQVRAVEPLISRKTVDPLFESAVASRPPLWLAVRAIDPKLVQAALGLDQPKPCSWTKE